MEKKEDFTFEDAYIDDIREYLFEIGDSNALSMVSGEIPDFRHFFWILKNNERIGFYEYHYLEGRDEAFFNGMYLEDIDKLPEEFVDELIMICFEESSLKSKEQGAKTIIINTQRRNVAEKLFKDKGFLFIQSSYSKELQTPQRAI